MQMAMLATLDAKDEELVQTLERESGAWVLAYAPAASEGPPPAFAARLKPAQLDQPAIERLKEAEQRTGSLMIAYEPVSEA
jgi:hypothetical protein